MVACGDLRCNKLNHLKTKKRTFCDLRKLQKVRFFYFPNNLSKDFSTSFIISILDFLFSKQNSRFFKSEKHFTFADFHTICFRNDCKFYCKVCYFPESSSVNLFSFGGAFFSNSTNRRNSLFLVCYIHIQFAVRNFKIVLFEKLHDIHINVVFCLNQICRIKPDRKNHFQSAFL